MRVGIIGTENSHVDHCLTYLNVEQRRGSDTRVVALAGGDSERNRKLQAMGGVDEIVDDATELLGLVDTVIVTDRDGALHREHAVPFLSEGLPVLVDKPLACSVADAEAIISTARQNNALVTSYSAVSWAPRVMELQASRDTIGEPRLVSTAGPADPASEYSGIFFYGIHPVDVAFRLVSGPVGDVHVERLPGSVVASATVGDARVVVTTVVPGEGRIPFHATVIGTKGTLGGDVPLPTHYVDAGLDAYFTMLETGQPPIDYDDLLRPIQFLAAMRAALES